MTVSMPVRYYARYPRQQPLGHVASSHDLDPASTALLLVDVFGRYDLGEDTDQLPSHLAALIRRRRADLLNRTIRPARDAAHEAGIPVVYVENRFPAAAWQGSEFAQVVNRSETGDTGAFDDLYVGTDYADYSDVIRPLPQDLVVPKTMYDGFYETTLDMVLRNLGVRTVICAGFAAEICLLHTAMGALYRNYRVIVLRDGTTALEFFDTADEEVVTKIIVRYYEALIGFTATTDDFMAACRDASMTATAVS